MTLIALPPSGGDHDDSYGFFARLRQAGPLHRVRLPEGREAWLVTRYDTMIALLRDKRLKRAAPASASAIDTPTLRRIAKPMLAPAAINALTLRLSRAARRLLETMPSGTPVDLVTRYCQPLSGLAFDVLLGVSPAQRPFVMKSVMPFSPAATAADRVAPRRDALGQLREHFVRQLRGREAKLADAYVGLAIAGFEPSVNLLSSSLLALLRNPTELYELTCHRGFLKAAPHELARFDGPAYPGMVREALEDLAVEGIAIPKGDLLLFPIAAAGRDPERFTDPDRLDWRRQAQPHLAFGYGAHVCPGAALATLIQKTGIEAFVKLAAHAALPADGPSPVWSDGPVRALLHLPIVMPSRAPGRNRRRGDATASRPRRSG